MRTLRGAITTALAAASGSPVRADPLGTFEIPMCKYVAWGRALLRAEANGRRVVAMEISPAHVDVGV